jgi:hypothetical protein
MCFIALLSVLGLDLRLAQIAQIAQIEPNPTVPTTTTTLAVAVALLTRQPPPSLWQLGQGGALNLVLFSLGRGSAAKISGKFLLYNIVESFDTNIHYYNIRNSLYLLCLAFPLLSPPCHRYAPLRLRAHLMIPLDVPAVLHFLV